jgi:lipoprotein signal peptidase
VEFALNFAWLVLSLTLVLVCVIYGRPAFNSKVQRIVVAVSLACLIAFLLFPVISMTDDLNSGAVLAETTNSKQWLPAIALFSLVGTGLLIAFSAQSSTWADGSILSEVGSPSQQMLSFHMSRRPPPAVV